MCGAVSFVVRDVPDRVGLCHCRQCRQWTGAALLGVTVKAASVTWNGRENIRERGSSPVAARAFCGDCGSSIWFRLLEGDEIELPIGLFDDPSGFELTGEIFVDERIACLRIEKNDRKILTRKETVARAAGVGVDLESFE